jgi:hypothetical protein
MPEARGTSKGRDSLFHRSLESASALDATGIARRVFKCMYIVPTCIGLKAKALNRKPTVRGQAYRFCCPHLSTVPYPKDNDCVETQCMRAGLVDDAAAHQM